MNSEDRPIASIWMQAQEYATAAEILRKNDIFQSAAIMAALSIEISLKSFLGTRTQEREQIEDSNIYFDAPRGHNLKFLAEEIKDADMRELCEKLGGISKSEFLQEIERHDGLFVGFRYGYEKNSPTVVLLNIVSFSRRLCDAILKIGEDRGN